MKHINTREFISQKSKNPLIDVRSPLEFKKGHINGAINIPLFSNDERKEIGIIYKNFGRINAIEKGLNFIGPRMKDLAIRARDLDDSNKRNVYCWRGGMRSEKMSWLFETVGLQCNVLKGGYKAYRNQMITDFKNIKELIILHGSTGSGKTEILYELEKKGEQIIDLEKLACHRGSAFGHIGMHKQPTAQQFQNDVHNALLYLEPDKRIWLEDESFKIGNVNLPDALWERMKSAQIIELNVLRSVRIKRLFNEYGTLPKEQLIESLHKLSGKISKENITKATQYIINNKLTDAIDLILDYYDRSYAFTKKRFGKNKRNNVTSNNGNAGINAGLLLKTIDSENDSSGYESQN